MILYGVASLAVLPAALYDRPRWRMVAVPATVAAVLFHFVSLMEMLNAAHHTMPVDAHEVQAVLALMMAVAFLLVFWRYRTVSLGVFVLPVAFLLVLLPAFTKRVEVLTPLLRSGWVWLHVSLLLAAYAALIVSLVASVLYLVQERRLKAKMVGVGGLPSLETMDQIALKSLLLGFPCMTAGLMVGSAYAEATVGAAYFADTKVLLSFAMWLAYVGMIFVRRQAGLRGRRAVYLSSFVFMVVMMVWAANQFSSVHKFGAP